MVKWGQTTNYAGTPIPPRPPSIAYIIIKKKKKKIITREELGLTPKNLT
jgi:hypothetical protein